MMQLYCRENEVRSVTGTAPTITVMSLAYGKISAIRWIAEQLTDFNEYCGKKEKMDDWQIEQLSRNIIADFGNLKASEIMLFLYRYKTGHYGPLYGVIDPQDLLVTLRQKFMPWRAKVAEEAENEQLRQEREKWAMTRMEPEKRAALLENLKKKNEERKYNPEDAKRLAMDIVNNLHNVPKQVLSGYRQLFMKNYGVTPEEYLSNYN